ncbi:CDP-alcohol phosphatidyltransferase [Salimicrobium jeotgali]|uniref:CDP-alcohol phosphatidyltransferase n=2 Tax=Salimicrobium TaxID=351195 RepID=K2H765_9BACI|nr:MULTISPECIES: CDP-alcohol phosphatidyltransferase family protein [Salimicrobium]AKG04872.1 CDP-alcohol phosphatidyltransferase [Salimicrobium jeotgali]EKE31535.1 CDP-alcohol phosphatidyltransferase [Salimicrobium jeotgali]MBM7696353.1 phosphatidylglycerophosphate synthase [Salimicrobium jeotgali]SIS46136.1 Phosphatidylglycerophosphate synthase [Salimicrobium salexigens]
MLDTHARKYAEPFIEHSADWFLRKGRTADQITVLAFLTGIGAAVWYIAGAPWAAVLFLWLSGFLDAVDGTMARRTSTSPFGTVLDVTFDRIVEIGIILAIAYVHPEVLWPLLLLSVSIIFSMTVFLTVGTVSEKQGMKSFYYQAGVAERTEGFVLFSLMILLPQWILFITLLYFAVETFTGMQRLFEAKRILR